MRGARKGPHSNERRYRNDRQQDHDRPTEPRQHGRVLDMVGARHGVEEITDAAALTIASWWPSAGYVGGAFAELASTGRVDADALSRDIAAVYSDAHPTDRQCLDMLGTWAIQHSSRQVSA